MYLVIDCKPTELEQTLNDNKDKELIQVNPILVNGCTTGYSIIFRDMKARVREHVALEDNSNYFSNKAALESFTKTKSAKAQEVEELDHNV